MRHSVDDFLDYLRAECGLAHNTIDAYRRDLRIFEAFLEEQGDTELERVTPTRIVAFCAAQNLRGMKESTVARRLVTVRSLFHFLFGQGRLRQDPAALVDSPKLGRSLPSCLSPEQTCELLEAPDTKTVLGLRDRAFLELLYATGARVSEVVSLQLETTHAELGFVRLFGKGGKERVVPLGLPARDAIFAYLEGARQRLLKKKPCRALLLSQKGSALRRESGWRIVKGYVRRLGLPPSVSPHSLRHSFATHLLANGADIRSVQEMLGHCRIETTEIYTHIASPSLRAAHRKHHPRA